MQITTAEIRQHYASLSDEALEEIDPADLTEAARECYEHEVKTRGLTGEAEPQRADEDPAAEPAESFELEPDWLEHAACACSYQATPGSTHALDAARARDVLLAAGVPCHLSEVTSEQSKDGAPYDVYRVLVPEFLNLKAIAVLDKEIFNADIEADLRTHFAELSDEELHALRPEVICAGLLDRVKRLTQVYNDEIARRTAE